MNNYKIEKLHKTILIITDEIDRICRKNNINYSMYGGTLIGAVRHQGFIPWDDDFDIAMLRKEYDRFRELCTSELDTRFNIISIDNKDNYGYNFIKITLKDTQIWQEKYSKRKNIFSEIFVDVFPIDNVPNNRIKKYIHQFKNYFLIKLLEERFDGLADNDTDPVKIVAYHIFGIINKLVSAEFLKNKLVKNSIRYAKIATKNVSSLSSCYGYDRETLSKEVFEEYIDLDFEGRSYQSVRNYDIWLGKVFGDYMQLPPVDKRVTHEFSRIDFGEY